MAAIGVVARARRAAVRARTRSGSSWSSLPYFAHRPVTFIMPPPSMQGGLEPHEAARFAKGKDGCGKVIAREETAVPTIRRSPNRTRSIPSREPDGDPDRGFRASVLQAFSSDPENTTTV